MKLKYVNIKELKDPSSHSKRKKKDLMLIEMIKKQLNSFDEDILEYYMSKYEIPESCFNKDDKITYLAENYSTQLEKDFLDLKRNYFEPKNILLRGKFHELDNFTFSIFFSKFELPFFGTNKNGRINYILENYSFIEIENAYLSSEEEAIKRKEKAKELKNQLDILDDKSLEVLCKKIHISHHLNKNAKKKSLLLKEPEMVLKEINKIKVTNSEEIELREKLNSLNDEDINALFGIFFDFGDFLDRKNKIYSLSKVDKERILLEINNLNN